MSKELHQLKFDLEKSPVSSREYLNVFPSWPQFHSQTQQMKQIPL